MGHRRKGEEQAKKILQRMGFTIVKSEGTIDEPPLNILSAKFYCKGKEWQELDVETE